MTWFDLFEFVFRFNIAISDTATWIYVLIALLGVIMGLGLLWGKVWNREWGFGGHLGSLLMVSFFAILCGYSVFNLRGVSRVESWMKEQRSTLASSISSSGHFNRSVLRSAWTQLSTAGGQEGLTPPDQAGNEVRLNNPEEAFALAAAAAEETRSALRTKMPFVIGAPLSTKSANEIATEAVDAVQFDSSRAAMAPRRLLRRPEARSGKSGFRSCRRLPASRWWDCCSGITTIRWAANSACRCRRVFSSTRRAAWR